MSGRVLIISYYWPPTGGSGVQRWVKFSKYLSSEGWQPVIYTPLNPEMTAVDESLAAEIPQDVEVVRRKIFEPYGIYRRLLGRRGGKAAAEVNPINSRNMSLGKRLTMFVRGNCFIPDPRCFWIGPSVRFLKKYLKAHPVDVIISTGPPHSMHLIALGLSRATGLPWVADFRDPWTRMFYFKHLGLTSLSERIHRKLEKKVLDGADVVVAVSPLVRDEFRTMTDTRVELITNGYDEADFPQVQDTPGERSFFNLTHTGLFASDGNPEILWTVLAEKAASDKEFAESLRIRLAGRTDEEIRESIRRAGLGANLEDRGYLPHGEAVAEQCSATVLLLPLRKEPEYRAVLPGKLFEYLAARRPVLGIGQSDGAMAAILSDTSAGETFDWEDREGLRDFVDRQWKAFREGRSLYCGKDISAYSRRELARRMAELLDTVTGKNNGKADQ